MKFSVGDLVFLKEEGRKATVVSVINSKIIEVRIKSGLLRTLRVDDVYVPPQEQSLLLDGKHPAEGFYLSFHPVPSGDHDGISALHLSFINRSAISVVLRVGLNSLNNSKEQQASSFSIVSLDTIPLTLLNGRPVFHCMISAHKEAVDWAKGNWFQHKDFVALPPKKLSSFLDEMQEQGRETFEIQIAKPQEDKKQEQDIPLLIPALGGARKNEEDNIIIGSDRSYVQDFSEIDLHAEKLQIPTHQLSSREILRQQLSALEHAIDRAVLYGKNSLVIVHGIGEGKLKEEVHLLLRQHNQISSYCHEWRPDYGYGATEAFLK